MAEQKNVFSFVKINISFLFQSVSVIIRISLSRKNTKMGTTSTQNILSNVSFQAEKSSIKNSKFSIIHILFFTNENRFLKFRNSSFRNFQSGIKFTIWLNFSFRGEFFIFESFFKKCSRKMVYISL